MLSASLDNDHPLADEFRRFVAQPQFPCLGAKSALARGRLSFVVARDISSSWDDLRIYPALFNFAKAYRRRRQLFQSFVGVFRGPRSLGEEEYEQCLWDRVQSLTGKDVWFGEDHDTRVSADPANPRFSVSFGSEAFFVVGLHPNASRPGRRFRCPAMVFNPHEQFEELRRQNIYEKLRESILERDAALAGSRNPMLQVFGEKSEARQYSGRIVEADWKCPYRRR